MIKIANSHTVVKWSYSLLCFYAVSLFGGDWIELFNGTDLDGWTKRGGAAVYEVVDGAIVGTSRPNTQNTFICPQEQFSDFELTFEVRCDPKLNSGVQIRSSNRLDSIPEGISQKSLSRVQNRVKIGSLFGPQVEIASNGNAGSVYFEGVGGWITKSFREKVEKIYNKDGWNRYRVLAKENRIVVWINENKVSDTEDNTSCMKSGFLGFQVHGVGKQTKPLRVRWSNIKIRKL